MATNERTPEVYDSVHTHSLNNNKTNALNTIGKKYVILKNKVINRRIISVVNAIKVYKLRGNINIINKT